MQPTTLEKLQQDSRVFFPKIARGHGKYSCKPNCTKEAHFDKKGEYVDGHFQSQATALRAHEGGYR